MRPTRRADLVFFALLAALPAFANERHLAFTYESAVMPPGVSELELWITPRWGREDPYFRLDNRAEFEIGVAKGLLTAVYINFDWVRDNGSSESIPSISNEWKYKILDPVADPFGLAIYGEVTAGLHEVELEAKLILDKKIGSFLVAFNAVGEHEWEFSDQGTEREIVLEGDLGLHCQITPGFGVGAELRNRSILSGTEGFESSTFLAGPVVSFNTESFWALVSFMPQLGSIKSTAAHDAFPGRLDLHDHERYAARLLLGFHL